MSRALLGARAIVASARAAIVAVVSAAALVALVGASALVWGPADAAAQDLGALLRKLEVVPVTPAAPPDFSLPRLDGRRVRLADVRGRVTLLYFWATW